MGKYLMDNASTFHPKTVSNIIKVSFQYSFFPQQCSLTLISQLSLFFPIFNGHYLSKMTFSDKRSSEYKCIGYPIQHCLQLCLSSHRPSRYTMASTVDHYLPFPLLLMFLLPKIGYCWTNRHTIDSDKSSVHLRPAGCELVNFLQLYQLHWTGQCHSSLFGIAHPSKS